VGCQNFHCLDFGMMCHCNLQFSTSDILRAKEEINVIKTSFKSITNENTSIVEQLLKLDRYIVAVDKGRKVFAIQRPIKPKKVSTGLSLIPQYLKY